MTTLNWFETLLDVSIFICREKLICWNWLWRSRRRHTSMTVCFSLPPSLLLFNNVQCGIGKLTLHFADDVKIRVGRSQCGNLKSPLLQCQRFGTPHQSPPNENMHRHYVGSPLSFGMASPGISTQIARFGALIVFSFSPFKHNFPKLLFLLTTLPG